MAISQLYPNQRPTLNLNFARSKTLDPRITFTRSSTATYVGSDGLIKTAAADEARFDHDPETGKSLGLLIEEAATNSINQSNNFDTTTTLWRFTSPTPNSGTAPDGTNTAWLLNSGPIEYDNNSSAGSFSVFVKKGTARYIDVAFGTNSTEPGAIFDLDTETIVAYRGNNPIGSNGIIQKFSNGWYRLSVTDSGGGGGRASIGPSTTYPWNVQLGPWSGTVYIWGAQRETLAFPTSYIPTSGSTVTRAADVCQITGDNFSSWYNTSQSTWYAEGDQLFINSSGNQEGTDSIFVDRYSNISTQRWREGSWRGMQGATSRVPVFSTPVTPEGDTVKTVYAIDGTNARMCVEGVLSTSVSSLGSYPGVTELRLAESARLVSVDRWNGHISRISYYPYRLTDSQLQELTS